MTPKTEIIHVQYSAFTCQPYHGRMLETHAFVLSNVATEKKLQFASWHLPKKVNFGP